MRFSIRVFVLITVMLVMGAFLSCKAISHVPDVSNETESTGSVRSSLKKKAKEYFENHEESLLILAKAFLSTNYASVTFQKGLQPYEISIDELDHDLLLYYSLVDPPFHEIIRETPENDQYASTDFAMIPTEYRGVDSNNITWHAFLCYGDNLAQTWEIPEYLVEKISEDWILFMDYHEGIIR